MPGVNIVTMARGDASVPLSGASGQFFVVGLAERGSTDKAVLVRGLADFEAHFGRRVTYSHLYDTLRTYFEEGGEQAWVVRAVGPAASSGEISVNDRATSPIPTLRIAANSAGAWSSAVTVTIEDGALDNTVRVAVALNGENVEVVNNLSTVQDIVAAFSRSPYIKVEDSGSATVAPDNLPEEGVYTLTAGSDDRDNVDEGSYVAALVNFPEGLGDGAVAIPGVGDMVHAGLIEHASTHRRIALLSMDRDAEYAEATTLARGLNSDAAGLFAPWVNVSDNAGGVRPIPPEGYVAGVRARAHKEVGPWRAAAGGIAVSRSLVGVHVEYSKAESDALDEAKVNVVRRINNTTRLYGWRSLSNDVANYGYLSHRDLLNRIVVESERRLEDYVFAPVDSKGQVLSSIHAELTGILEPVAQAGGLYARFVGGQQIDPGYLVETGSSVNSDESLARNEVRARVSLRIAPTGALISLTIVKVGLLQGL